MMGEMHKDATGRQITKGSYIAYSVSVESHSNIKFGVVVKLKEQEVTENCYDDATKSWYPKLVTRYSLQAISAEKSWQTQNKWAVQGKREGKLARVTSIERLERVILLEPDQMNPEAKEVLDIEMHARGL